MLFLIKSQLQTLLVKEFSDKGMTFSRKNRSKPHIFFKLSQKKKKIS